MKLEYKKEKYKALTLIESLVYIGLFGVIFLAVMQFMFVVTEGNLMTQKRLEMSRQKIFVYQHLEASFLEAELFDLTSSSLDIDNGVLTLIDQEGGVDTILKYEIVNSALSFTRGISDSVTLTPANIVVTKLFLEDIANAQSEIIGINILLEFEYLDSNNITQNLNHMYKLR